MDRSTGETSTSQPTTLRVSAESFVHLRRAHLDESGVKPIFEEHAQDGLLPAEKLRTVLDLLDLCPRDDELNRLVKTCAADENFLSVDELLALCVLLSVQSPSAPVSPSRKFLTQRRPYMESGYLGHEEAIVSYIAKLQEHKKKCERESRYTEAQAAAGRLHELKTTEAERRCQDMLERHRAELKEVDQAFLEERTQLNRMWDLRIQHFEADFEKQVEKLKTQQFQESQEFWLEQGRRRPVRPKYSRDLLNKRKIEEYLAKQGEYTRAHAVKEAADSMETAEMQTTIAAFEAELRLKEHKLVNKHQQEMEAMIQRGARGRAELEIQRVEETERRGQRFKNVVSELQNLQKLEVVHLENFLESQAQAGKRDPLPESSFRRHATIHNF
ncbi:hypothetical protein BSKO_05593 [Bryopsis sp. KO-2023]|nr:hypothetical protein BSKO_05593 [Bryopsis sp. KO-2023]